MFQGCFVRCARLFRDGRFLLFSCPLANTRYPPAATFLAVISRSACCRWLTSPFHSLFKVGICYAFSFSFFIHVQVFLTTTSGMWVYQTLFCCVMEAVLCKKKLLADSVYYLWWLFHASSSRPLDTRAHPLTKEEEEYHTCMTKKKKRSADKATQHWGAKLGLPVVYKRIVVPRKSSLSAASPLRKKR